jgi:hypothetical protein
MRNDALPRTPSKFTVLAAGLAGTATAILLAVMASILPAKSYVRDGRERVAPVVLPTVEVVASRN